MIWICLRMMGNTYQLIAMFLGGVMTNHWIQRWKMLLAEQVLLTRDSEKLSGVDLHSRKTVFKIYFKETNNRH